jgi:predicted aspartyl protease
MPSGRFRRTLVAMAALMNFGAANAASCDLKQIASIPMQLTANNRLLLDATINNQPVKIMVDTGAALSALNKKFATRMGMSISSTRENVYGLSGKALNEQTSVETLRLGGKTSADILFVVKPTGSDGTDGEAVGLFGADYLQNYDVEIDIAGGKLNLFSQDHCPGQMVYWAPEFFKTPIFFENNTPYLRPMLDIAIEGKGMRALLDTGAPHSVMRLAVAAGRMGLSPDTPGMEYVGEGSGVEGHTLPVYRHTFQLMNFGEITLHNTPMEIIPIDTAAHVNAIGSHIKISAGEEPDVLIGMSLMKQLHLIIAYSENAIYYTIATPPKQAAGQ